MLFSFFNPVFKTYLFYPLIYTAGEAVHDNKISRKLGPGNAIN